MIKTFTQNDVVRFVYDEMSFEESKLFIDTMHINSELKDEYIEQLQTKLNLQSILVNPPSNAVENILQYSSSQRKSPEKVIG